MRYVASAFGSAGDFLPTLAVAQALARGGHDVTFAVVGSNQALRSGRPSVVVPLAFDQFGLSWQVEQQGTGVRVAKRGRSRASIASALRRVCEEEAIGARAREVASLGPLPSWGPRGPLRTRPPAAAPPNVVPPGRTTFQCASGPSTVPGIPRPALEPSAGQAAGHGHVIGAATGN